MLRALLLTSLLSSPSLALDHGHTLATLLNDWVAGFSKDATGDAETAQNAFKALMAGDDISDASKEALAAELGRYCDEKLTGMLNLMAKRDIEEALFNSSSRDSPSREAGVGLRTWGSGETIKMDTQMGPKVIQALSEHLFPDPCNQIN